NGDGELLVEELAASRVERKGLIGCGEVCVERRLREAGLDQQHSDSVLADLVVERFGVALEGVLARCVQGHERDWDEPDDRTDVDDPAAALCSHHRQYCA